MSPGCVILYHIQPCDWPCLYTAGYLKITLPRITGILHSLVYAVLKGIYFLQVLQLEMYIYIVILPDIHIVAVALLKILFLNTSARNAECS